MDRNELIKFRGKYSIEELSEILEVDKNKIVAWEETGEIDDESYINLKEMYEEECDIPNYSEEMQDAISCHLKGLKIWLLFPYPLIATIVFLILGFTIGAWHPAWTIFLTLPIYYSLGWSIFRKNLTIFSYPFIVLIIYLLLGFLCGLWSPFWILFLTIPLYYEICMSLASKKISYIAYANMVVIIYLVAGMVFNRWHPWWVLFLTIITYADIIKAISYKNFWFFNIYPVFAIAYIISSYFTGLWHPFWVMLIPIPIYQGVRLYFLFKRRKSLGIK